MIWIRRFIRTAQTACQVNPHNLLQIQWRPFSSNNSGAGPRRPMPRPSSGNSRARLRGFPRRAFRRHRRGQYVHGDGRGGLAGAPVDSRDSWENPAAQIVVTGCYAQRAPEELAALEGVSWVVGNSHKPEIPRLVGEMSQGGRETVPNSASRRRPGIRFIFRDRRQIAFARAAVTPKF